MVGENFDSGGDRPRTGSQRDDNSAIPRHPFRLLFRLRKDLRQSSGIALRRPLPALRAANRIPHRARRDVRSLFYCVLNDPGIFGTIRRPLCRDRSTARVELRMGSGDSGPSAARGQGVSACSISKFSDSRASAAKQTRSCSQGTSSIRPWWRWDRTSCVGTMPPRPGLARRRARSVGGSRRCRISTRGSALGTQ